MQSSGVPFFVSGGGSGGGGSAFSWEGAWDAGTTYAADDVVEYNGSSYIAIQAGTNKQPDTEAAYWELMAEKGDTGAAGAPGATGAKGDKGDTGDTGATGPGVATAGTTGQYLKKASNTNYDTAWASFALVNADIDASADIAWSKVSKTGSSLADLATRSAGDLNSGTLPLARLSGITNTEISDSANINWSKISKTSSSLADLATRTTANLSDFPSQTSNANKYLKTDGTNLSWSTVSGSAGTAFAMTLLFGG